MTLVYVSKNWNTYPLDLIRQTPNFSGVWNNIQLALPDLWLKLYWIIHFAFLAFAEGLAVPRY